MVHCSVVFQIENYRRKETTKTDLRLYFNVTKEREIHSFLTIIIFQHICVYQVQFEINTLFKHEKGGIVCNVSMSVIA